MIRSEFRQAHMGSTYLSRYLPISPIVPIATTLRALLPIQLITLISNYTLAALAGCRGSARASCLVAHCLTAARALVPTVVPLAGYVTRDRDERELADSFTAN